MDRDLLFGEKVREIEILEFIAGGNSYGIDINDVREVIPNSEKIRRIPNADACIEGIIMPRDFLIPLINIARSIEIQEEPDTVHNMVVVTNINNSNIGFLVERVAGMHRSSTDKMIKPEGKLSTGLREIVSAIMVLEDRMIEVIEPRKIIEKINPEISPA